MSETAVKSNNDLWISEDDQVVLEGGPQSVQDALSDVEDSILNPTIVTNIGEQETPATEVEEKPQQIGPPPVVEEDEPQVYSDPDGSSVTIEKTKKGWKATLDSGTGAQPEVFKGATKDEMFARLAVGKINATKKIRELSRQSLLGDETPKPPAKPAVEEVKSKRLTPEEVFDIKAQLEDNPDLALEKWFQKKTGMALEELVNLTKTAKATSESAREQSDDVAATQILQNWVDITDDYVTDTQNRDAILAWLLKYKARQNPKNFNVASAVEYLFRSELLTTENLDLAWDDLKADGVAILPRENEPAPPPEPKATVRTRTRPAAGLGIRSSETRTVRQPVVNEDAPVAVETMTLEETTKALNDLRKFKLTNPAEYERLKAIGERKRKGLA
jgi:hypothetical protein